MTNNFDFEANLCVKVIEVIEVRCNLHVSFSALYLGLFGTTARVRVFKARAEESGPVEKMVQIEVYSKILDLSSSVLYAFTDRKSALPHFTLDTVLRAGIYGLHCDLIPKLPMTDTKIARDYYHELYAKLTLCASEISQIEDLERFHLSKAQLELMSPVVLAYLARNRQSFCSLQPFVEKYLQHWLSLIAAEKDGSLKTGVVESELAKLDIRKRVLLFSPKTDQIWVFLWFLLGYKQAEEIRHLMIGDLN